MRFTWPLTIEPIAEAIARIGAGGSAVTGVTADHCGILRAQHLGDRRELIVLLFDIGAELGGAQHVHNLAGIDQPLGNDPIVFGDVAKIGSDLFALAVRHIVGAVEAARVRLHMVRLRDILPASAAVGISGAVCARFRLVTSRTLMRPVCSVDCTAASEVDSTWMRLSARSFGACMMSR